MGDSATATVVAPHPEIAQIAFDMAGWYCRVDFVSISFKRIVQRGSGAFLPSELVTNVGPKLLGYVANCIQQNVCAPNA